MRLTGKIALITGGGTGIGRAIALAFSREGAKVALMGRRPDPLIKTAREIGAAALVVTGDLSRKEDIGAAIAATIARFGGINVLVNNGGVLYVGTAETQTEQQWDETFNVNVKGLWLMTRAVLPHMRKAGGGSIINMSSVLGLVGFANRAAYAASKGAVTLLTKSMAMDHAHENIRVNCICPAVVETDLINNFINNAPDPAQARAERIAMHPMKRFGTPEDIAACAVFLAGDESKWTTGAAIPVDGGYTAR